MSGIFLSLCIGCCSELFCTVPGQEDVGVVRRRVGNMGQDMAQPRFGISALELGRDDW